MPKEWNKYQETGKLDWENFAEKTVEASVSPDAPEISGPLAFAGKTISNIPGSAYQLGKGIYEAISSPLETGKAIGKTAVGGVQKLADVVFPESLRQPPAPGEDYRAYAEQLGQFFAQRYGGMENLKKTVSEDPVGFLVDASMLLTGGGSAAARVGLQAGKTVSRVGEAVEPLNIIRRGLGAIPKSIPSKMYESAAKFSTTLTPKERTLLARTALKYEISPTYEGVKRAQEAITKLNSQIETMIKDVSIPGREIPIADLFKEWPKLLDDASLSGKPIANQKLINGIKNQIENANKLKGREGLTAIQLQALKKRIYRDLESYYEKTSAAPAAVQAQKAIARAAKEAIEELVPEVKMLNAKEGALIELRDAIERSAARIKNRDIMGIGMPIKIGAGGAIGGLGFGAQGGAIGGSLGLLWGVVDTPIVKSKLAIAIHQLSSKGVKIQPSETLKRLGIYQIGRIEREGD